MKLISSNRKAYHDYIILESFEAGIVLTGTEIKSIRAGQVNLREGYARTDGNGDMWLYNVHISKYDPGSRYNHEPTRNRKLLLHRKQINDLAGRTAQKGFTLVPLKLYLNKKGIAKVEIGLARGKKIYDKRESMVQRQADRDMERAIKMPKTK
jgi:SsrA-binding protein